MMAQRLCVRRTAPRGKERGRWFHCRPLGADGQQKKKKATDLALGEKAG
jgi:hypothetical protein